MFPWILMILSWNLKKLPMCLCFSFIGNNPCLLISKPLTTPFTLMAPNCLVLTWEAPIFYAAGLLPVVCQFGREFFRVCWLLSDKNLNALKTSRYKTFLCRLRLTPYFLAKSFDFLKELPCQSGESNPRPPSPKMDALPYELLGLWYESMEILKFI